MATILEFDRSIIESMMSCDEERWNLPSSPRDRGLCRRKKSLLLEFCLNAVSFFQGSCGGDGCDIHFHQMTIKDRFKIDFHHLDRSTKFFAMTGSELYPSFVIIEELRKCVAICRNCHSGETHDQYQASYYKKEKAGTGN